MRGKQEKEKKEDHMAKLGNDPRKRAIYNSNKLKSEHRRKQKALKQMAKSLGGGQKKKKKKKGKKKGRMSIAK